ncbi:MAG TPA: hypothetical protein VMW44_00325 [Candidatus Bathyarchaeia archaeon]|nr:hypothetical protein [Candidatus Bathyarchaeia archaeon]
MGFTMRGDPLPDQDHISRYCAPKTAPDGQPTGASFMLRQDQKFLSVNWMEYFGDIGIDAQINKIREYIELSLAASGLFAVLNVGEIIDQVQRNSERQLAVLYEPTPGDPSHSGVYGYRYEDDLVADLIAEFVLITYPAKKT